MLRRWFPCLDQWAAARGACTAAGPCRARGSAPVAALRSRSLGRQAYRRILSAHSAAMSSAPCSGAGTSGTSLVCEVAQLASTARRAAAPVRRTLLLPLPTVITLIGTGRTAECDKEEASARPGAAATQGAPPACWRRSGARAARQLLGLRENSRRISAAASGHESAYSRSLRWMPRARHMHPEASALLVTAGAQRARSISSDNISKGESRRVSSKRPGG